MRWTRYKPRAADTSDDEAEEIMKAHFHLPDKIVDDS